MKQGTIQVMAALTVGLAALASLAPAAGAERRSEGYYRGDERRGDEGAYRDGSCGDRGRDRDGAYRDGSYGRDRYGAYRERGGDYYYDPYCDVARSRVSSLKSHYRHCDHPPVVQKIDGRSGRLIKSYAYDDGEWRECRSERRGSRRGDRYGSYERDDWRGRDEGSAGYQDDRYQN